MDVESTQGRNEDVSVILLISGIIVGRRYYILIP